MRKDLAISPLGSIGVLKDLNPGPRFPSLTPHNNPHKFIIHTPDDFSNTNSLLEPRRHLFQPPMDLLSGKERSNAGVSTTTFEKLNGKKMKSNLFDCDIRSQISKGAPFNLLRPKTPTLVPGEATCRN